VIALIAVALVVVGYVVATRWVAVSGPERRALLKAACDDADGLRRAHLLDEAAVAYGAIGNVDHAWSCEGGLAAAKRENSATAWREEILGDLRISGEQVERARLHRRAYVLHRGPSVQEGRRRARARATNAYLLALLIDPGATGARRGLQRVLRGLGGPTRQVAADRRCELAGRILNVGLLPEARTVYAQALRSGRTTACIRAGLRKLRASRAEALGHAREANQLRAAGDDEKARDAYVAAFATDSSLVTARRALRSVPGPNPAHARRWSQGSQVASDALGTAKAVTTDVQGNPATVAVAAGLLAVLFLLVAFALQQLARVPILRPWMDRVGWLQRFTRTRIKVETFDAEGDVPVLMITDEFEDAVVKPLLAADAGPESEAISLDAIAGEVAVKAPPGQIGDLLQATSFAGIAAVVNWLANAVPRQEIKVTGRLLERGAHGRGLKLQVVSRRGRPLDSHQFWHDEVLASAGDATSDSLDLARFSAAWVMHRKARRRVRGEWRVTGWFRVARACQDVGRYADAVEAYQEVLMRKRFAGHLVTLHNLSVSQIRAGDYEGALDTLNRLDAKLRHGWTREERLKRRFSAAYNRALALQYLGRHHEARKVTQTLLRTLMHRPEGADDSTRLEPPALMLHAGLLMSELDPLEARDDSTGDFAPAEVRRAAAAIAKRTCNPPGRRALWEAIDRGDERAEDIEAYVRDRAGRDRRACYNLACFEVGLAGRFPPMRERLLALALADATQALRDRKLAAWAREDPALRTELLEGCPGWKVLLDRQPAAPAEPKRRIPVSVATPP
jgi:tetratricopeptide (TPR) repeat protein